MKKKLIKSFLLLMVLLLAMNMVVAEGNFTDLQNEIIQAENNGNNITLESNYTWNTGENTDGIEISNDNFILDGNFKTVNGDGVARIFNITGNNVTIKNLNLINGFASVNGGGIHTLKNNINILNSNFVNNYAGESGGAIYSYGATNVAYSNFLDNTVEDSFGGAIYSNLDLNIDSSNFNNNSATGFLGLGGATYSAYGTTTINSNFTFNNAGSGGGAIYCEFEVEIYDSNFYNNAAGGGLGGDGGAVLGMGFIDIYNSIFENNTATDSGGAILSESYIQIFDSIFNNNKATSNTSFGGAVASYDYMNIEGSTFTNNIAGARGGALYSDNGDLEVDKSTFINNTVKGNGGAIYAVQSAKITNSEFTDNHANVSGGAVSSPNVNVANSNFYKNTAYNGGVIDGDNVTVENSNFNENIGILYGGAIYSDYINIINSNFNKNNATYGGAIHGKKTSVSNSNFNNNAALNGGAISTISGDLTIISSTFTDNIVRNSGGAILTEDSDLTVKSSNFTNNLAKSGDGGAIEKVEGDNLLIANSIFINNSATGLGGAIDVLNSDVNITGSYFEKNNASEGSSIYVNGKEGFINYNVILDINPIHIYPNNYNLNLNWWGDNENPLNKISGHYTNITLDNYYIMNITSNDILGKKTGDIFNFNYTLKLNDTSVSNDVSKLAKFTTDFTINNALITSIDGRYNKLINTTLMNLISNITAISNDIPVVSLIINAEKGTPSLNVNIEDIVVGEDGILNIETSPNVEGNVTIKINNNTLGTYKLANGTLTLPITNLNAGNYSITVTFNGNDNFASTSKTVSLNVLNDHDGVLTADNLTMYFRNGTRLIINLTDTNGKGIANVNISVLLNGVTTVRATDKDGIMSMAINLNPGNYTVLTYLTNSNLIVKNLTTTLEVLPNIFVEDLVKYYLNGSQYFITVLDGNGLPIANTNVSVNINGVFYNRETNANGVAMLTIRLIPGEYIATAIHPINGLQASSNVIVLPTLIGENLEMFYKNGSVYSVKVLDGQGQAIKNTNVKMNINGVYYERSTNDDGIASLALNLFPGDYIITVIHPETDLMISNNITVKPTLIGHDLTKRFGEEGYYVLNVLNGLGDGLADAEVIININGMIYSRTSNHDGTASLKINLDPGSYIATATWNGYSTSNIITVNP